jgi:hypothetical protein
VSVTQNSRLSAIAIPVTLTSPTRTTRSALPPLTGTRTMYPPAT